MSENTIVYLLPYIFAAVFPLCLGIFVRYENQAPIGKTFSAILIIQGVWSTASLMEIVSVSLKMKIFWDDFQYLAVGILAVLVLYFSFHYEGKHFKGGRSTLWILMIFPIAIWIFVTLNFIHLLHRTDARIDASIPFGELVYSIHLPLILFLFPIYTMSLIGISRLFLFSLRTRGTRRMAALCVFAGFILPYAGTMLTLMSIRINGRLESSPLWLVWGDLLIAFGIFRYRMAGVLPIARQKIIENLRDPVVVIDQEGIVVDCNNAIHNLFSASVNEIRGLSIKEIFPTEVPGCINFFESSCSESEITMEISGEQRDYSLRVFPVLQNEDVRILVFRDITELKRAEYTLRSLSADLEKKVEERALELEAEIKLRRKNEESIIRINTEIDDTRKEIMLTLADVVENRGRETAWHVARVSEYCRILSVAAGYSSADSEKFANAAAMHDIGKIRIPEAILHIKGRLNPEEVIIMRSHTRAGAAILGKSNDPLLIDASRIALEHHEHWDGTGYPDGKKESGISLDARIVAVADVFDSLAQSRPDRLGWNIDMILEYFRTQRGKIFEPSLVDILFANLDLLLAVADRYSEVAAPVHNDIEEFPI